VLKQKREKEKPHTMTDAFLFTRVQLRTGSGSIGYVDAHGNSLYLRLPNANFTQLL